MNFLQQLVQRRHLLAWLGTWTLMMVMAWGAIIILLPPNLGERPMHPSLTQSPSADRAARSTPAGTFQSEPRPARFHSSNHGEMALWSMVIVAIACIYGSLVLTQHIRGGSRRG